MKYQPTIAALMLLLSSCYPKAIVVSPISPRAALSVATHGVIPP